ncbi:hypothetical protein GGR58DRAFT_352259 [Xylaria digitata]|nr:hypothetical protein GGR58DRAFT_352259 [Xylaria digitata]
MATQKSAARSRSALTSTQTASTNAPVAEAAPEEATPHSQALCRLEPLQPVLAGLVHRNRNQHRRAAWWRYFGMLRRNCAKLVEDLISADAAARKNAARAAKAAKVKGKKRRREELAAADLGTGIGGKDVVSVQGTEADVETNANVARRAPWLRDVLVPKCYLAFSQLTADNQFAPLGVVLLGILAQIQAACDIVAPRPAAPAASSPFSQDVIAADKSQLPSVENTTMDPEDGNLSALAPKSKASESQTSREGKAEIRSEKGGGGRTISREDVERAAELHKKGTETGTVKAKNRDAARIAALTTDRARSSTPSKTPEVRASTPSSSKGQMYPTQERGEDNELARPAKKMKAAPGTEQRGKGTTSDDKNKKKKKKTKKGDEFDDLFKDLF